MEQERNESKKGTDNIWFCLSVSQKVRFLFTSFLQLQKFLWLLLRCNIEQFSHEKKELLDQCGFSC